MAEIKQTPLYAVHKALGARATVFAGWEMPLEYSGIIDEVLNARKAAGLFDISHLGKIEATGPRALDAIQLATTNDASRLADGQVHCSLLCNHSGGVVDDVTIYRFNKERFMLCVNAVNTEKVFCWLREKFGEIADIKDKSSDLAVLAIQGPSSQQALQKICGNDLPRIKHCHFFSGNIGGIEAVVSRTGYTGEDGFEIYLPPSAAENIWGRIMEGRTESGVKPAGLGARDSLRLEMGYALYGNEITEEITPIEAGLERFVKFQKPSFIGKEALLAQTREGIRKRLIGFEMAGRGIPRSHYAIHSDDRKVGYVTSGGYSPSLGKAIGMGYVETPFVPIGNRIGIEIRGKMVEAVVVPRPFYKK